MTFLIKAACWFLTAAVVIGSTSADDEPLFRNSIVSTDIDFISVDDKSAFQSIRFLGQGRKEMPDKRNDQLMVDRTYTFEARFDDETNVEIWIHPSVETLAKAQRFADMLCDPIGKLPHLMRKRLSHVVVQQGNETAFAESEGHFFVLYTKNMETRIRNRDLEETVFHESVHATLDSNHLKSSGWLAAQKADNQFVTKYAASKPQKEDLAESALFAYTLLKHPGRLAPEMEQWIQSQIPHRLAYLQKLFTDETQP